LIDGSLWVPANRYREDLKHAAIGSERHSFRFTLTDGIPFASDAMAVRGSLDEAVFFWRRREGSLYNRCVVSARN